MEIIQILKSHSDVHVIDSSIPLSSFIAIDLSENNAFIDEALVSNLNTFVSFIQKILLETSAKAAYGGYNEKRQLYKRSTIFYDKQNEERNIHIGLDIWAAAETTVLAALDGEVHSFKNNEGKGNYGPTIILHHKINNCEFYTLYGHLSIESIAKLSPGDTFRKGDEIGKLGHSEVNGDYPPHLHFQIIRDLANYSGDYPGVCSEKDLAYYLSNCPDPNLLLKI